MTTIKLSKEWRVGPQLKSGGFGYIHAAESEGGREVVVKLIPKMPGASRELLFEELSGIPNVVPILDRGEWKEFWVLVMARAEKSLREHLVEHGGCLSLNEALQVLTNIAIALAAIQGHVVHRDLKPENVLLLNGAWCLADFGIARYAEATTAPDTRKFAMTPAYAAPEQWRGERATSATDVYALGVVAYESVSGRLPFPGPDVHDFREQHLQASPPPLPNLPSPVASLISECLYKAPEARPTPQNLLARLRATMQPASEAAQRLQQANLAAVQSRAEASRQASVAKSEAERRAELFRAAEQSLEAIAAALHDRILAAAPESAPPGGAPWPCSLNGAQLSVAPARQAPQPSQGQRYSPPFEVIAHSKVTLQIPQNQWSYEGRSHSLWYCDAQQEGVFRWYETAFMIHAFIPMRGRLNPFALDPGEDSYGAVFPITTEYQVAWPFTSIDQGNSAEFIERWMVWFADAAEGNLRHPTHMPERDPRGSWRRG